MENATKIKDVVPAFNGLFAHILDPVYGDEINPTVLDIDFIAKHGERKISPLTRAFMEDGKIPDDKLTMLANYLQVKYKAAWRRYGIIHDATYDPQITINMNETETTEINGKTLNKLLSTLTNEARNNSEATDEQLFSKFGEIVNKGLQNTKGTDSGTVSNTTTHNLTDTLKLNTKDETEHNAEGEMITDAKETTAHGLTSTLALDTGEVTEHGSTGISTTDSNDETERALSDELFIDTNEYNNSLRTPKLVTSKESLSTRSSLDTTVTEGSGGSGAELDQKKTITPIDSNRTTTYSEIGTEVKTEHLDGRNPESGIRSSVTEKVQGFGSSDFSNSRMTETREYPYTTKTTTTYPGGVRKTIESTAGGDYEEYLKTDGDGNITVEVQDSRTDVASNGNDDNTTTESVEGLDETLNTVTRIGSETTNHTGSESVTRSGTETTSQSGTDALTRSGTETTTHSGTDTLTKSGTEKTTNIGTDALTRSGTETTTHTGTDTSKETRGLESSSNVDSTNTESYNNYKETTENTSTQESTQTSSGSKKDDGEETRNETITRTKTVEGDTGVTATAKLLREEYNFWSSWNYIDAILLDVANELGLQVRRA